ncbi:hypothetical protein [Methylobacterium gnaphalii]|uniref:Tail sheath protein subtilisin-like domain-containing protein n=1 Tax=Methylobacterium gnaphalii TaxID=1010610 RepID=A0A512JPG1_9HYPH|nr:hypothetical protein [Methylobacterium gnaphalii]GEP11829.1 hypothetical protein MGN01_36740 [Methylobacterium gnaphalii]GJD69413.1 Putative prophage major tail sheath protein [Methylobacterium gnaphalii]GLS51396.1 hypothetical protein GCM10007885_42530 [Methylobacterium gnaphalii]
MTAPYFGYQSTYPNDDVASVTGGDYSKIGLCSTSSDADASVFPLNVAVRFTSTDPAFLSKIGTGDLAAALTGINDQLGGSGADVVVVRVAEGVADDAETKLAQTQANIIGDAGAGTGLWALRNAPQTVKAACHLWYAGHTAEAGVDGADNPVRAALAHLLEAAKAIAIVDVDPTSKVNAIAARELMSSKRMMPMGVAAKVYETVNGAATLVTRPMAPRVLGLIAATDNNYRNGMPFDSFANKPILGIADINRPIGFDIGDGSTEGQLMLASDIAIVVQGESANAGAIADGGFVFIGFESAATTAEWTQIHQVRGADYIDEEFGLLARKYLGGRYTARRAESLLKSFGQVLDDHVYNEDIVGYLLKYPTDLNTIAQVTQGNFSIRTNQELYPIIRKINNEVRHYPEAITALVNTIVANVGTQSRTVS